jgi:hypothetical protein
MWKYYLAVRIVRRQHRPNLRGFREIPVTLSKLMSLALEHKTPAALDYVGLLCEADSGCCDAEDRVTSGLRPAGWRARVAY